MIGQQGSGKTSTAIHIMTDEEYEKWTKMKLTSWEDLLAYDFKEDTLIYIDNLFDGFLYNLDVDRWWDSLIYFYFQCIKQKSNIRLLITAKETEIERACSFVKEASQMISEACFIRENVYPLSHDEKKAILKCQINLPNSASQLIITEKLIYEIKEVRCPIGFPLCAHMYAFEEKQTQRDISIFQSPRTYVRNQIIQRIKDNETGDVKALFLFLIYCSPLAPSHSSEKPDLRYGEECEAFLDNILPDDCMNKMKPFSFHNLNERAEELLDTVLIRPNGTFEFKHQIYLEGAIDYFFREHFDSCVDFFPLSILRTCEMQDVSKDQMSKLIDRMKKEIVGGAVSEAFSCKAFEEFKFEKEFCNKIVKESQIMDALLSATDKKSGFELPVIFWANKYNLLILSKTLMNICEKNDKGERQQFVFARFGECCSYDENFIKVTNEPQEMEDLLSLILKFESWDGKKISHLILSSKRSDNDAFHCFKRILNEAQQGGLKFDKSLIECVLKQNEYSRLQCLIQVLQTLPQNERTYCLYVRILVNELQAAYSESDSLLELELLCRISILVVYGANEFTTKYSEVFFKDINHHPRPIYLQKNRLQKYMAERINRCIACISSDGNVQKKEDMTLFIKQMTKPLMKAIDQSIGILAEKEDAFSTKVNSFKKDSKN